MPGSPASPTRTPRNGRPRSAGWAHLALGLGALLTLTLSGCVRVKPWERETLSLRCMTPGVEIAEDRFRQHWQTSREGSEGGLAAVGGGCGCN